MLASRILLTLPVAAALFAAAPQAAQARFCGTITAPLRYSVQAPSSVTCSSAKSVVRRYLKGPSPRAATVSGWRCSYNQGGTVAEGTAFKVTCRRDGRRINGFYRGA